jgi:hypothetical protein
VVLVELLLILNALDSKEYQSEKHREHEHEKHDGALRSLGSPDCEHDGQTAADQDGGVNSAEPDGDRCTGSGKVSEVLAPINQVRAEQSTEEHDFGSQEDPHAKIGSVLLLLFSGEVMEQRRAMDVVVG